MDYQEHHTHRTQTSARTFVNTTSQSPHIITDVLAVPIEKVTFVAHPEYAAPANPESDALWMSLLGRM